MLTIKSRRDEVVPAPRGDATWPAERCAELANLVGMGLNPGQAAQRMGTSRNAVIGKARRLGLVWRPRT